MVQPRREQTFIMVKEVRRGSMEVAGVDVPTLDRKGRAELIFFVSLAAQRNEISALGQCELEQWSRNS